MEKRDLLAATPISKQLVTAELGYKDPQVVSAIRAITSTASTEPMFLASKSKFAPANEMSLQTLQSSSLIDLDDFRADPRFAAINGTGFSTVIIDSGIDLDHPYFGSDLNGDGISDRIVFSYDFADGDNNASDVDGHGSNVSSIVASSDSTHRGMAPGANIIHLKVFRNDGSGQFSYTESALQWVVANAATYNIASVNMSLGDSGNYTSRGARYGLGDELAALAALNVIVASASGNDFFEFNSAQGVSYPSSDPNSLSVGAVFDASIGPVSYSGPSATTTGPGRITPFSQRHSVLTDVMAPGAPITGASESGGTVTQHGTSQASPHVSGVAVLAQQLATQTLGRRLTPVEFRSLLRSSATTINDGDDEDDNVTNTGLNFPLVNVMALGNAIWAMGSNPSASATTSDVLLVAPGPISIEVTYFDDTGIDVSDLDNNDIRVTGPNGFTQSATFQSLNINSDGTPRTATYTIPGPIAGWTAAANGTYNIEMLANQVSDIDSTFIAAGVIGTFSVAIAPTLGPDAFGYLAAPVPYQFIDISSTGTLVLAGDDDNAVNISPGLGFEFDFYGLTYTNLFVSSNGLVTFGSGNSTFTNTDLTASPTQPSIAAYWDDLDSEVGGGVFWQLLGSGDRQTLVLQWETEYFDDSGAVSFQAILNEYDNSVRVSYRQLVGTTNPGMGSSATIGIKAGNTQGNNRLVAAFNQSNGLYAINGRSFDFYLGNRAPFGLTIDNDSVLETTSVGSTIATFAVGDNDTNDSHTYEFLPTPGENDNQLFSIFNSELRIAAPLDFETKESYLIHVRVRDSNDLFIDSSFRVNAIDVPEMIQSPVLGDGTIQRSLLDKVVLIFEDDVEIESDAFQLIKRGTEGGTVTTSFNKTINSAGQTEVTLTFSGNFTRGNIGALVDGYYQLTILGSKIKRNNVAVDFNGDGVSGDNMVIGADPNDKFFALYGDANGDGVVGVTDFLAFRNAFGKTSGQSGYNRVLDYNGGGVGVVDFLEFRSRFGKPKITWQ